MRTDRLARNDLSATAYAWYLRYLAAIDAKDMAAYAEFLADDCVLRMNNADVVAGKQAIVAMLAPYWQSFLALEHDLLAIYGNDRGWVLEARNHYTRLDGSTATVRAIAITERNDSDLAASIRIYSDTSPVFAQGAA